MNRTPCDSHDILYTLEWLLTDTAIYSRNKIGQIDGVKGLEVFESNNSIAIVTANGSRFEIKVIMI